MSWFKEVLSTKYNVPSRLRSEMREPRNKTIQETRAENQETRLYSVEIRDSNVLRIFHFDILHSALDIRHWFQFRISYLVLPISTSYFLPGTLYFPSPFNTLRSAFDVGLDSVFRISYFLLLLRTWYLVLGTSYIVLSRLHLLYPDHSGIFPGAISCGCNYCFTNFLGFKRISESRVARFTSF